MSMHPGVFSLLMAASIVPTASAVIVEFGDGDFAPGTGVCVPGSAAGSASELAGYELVKDVRGGPDGFTCIEHRDTGGNPGAYAHVTISPQGGQITACMFKDGAVYEPGVSGPVAYFDYTDDGFCVGGGPQCMSGGLCIRQAGNFYAASAGFVPEPAWTPRAAYGLGPGDFSWLSGPASSVPLDLSAGGAPLQFGFYRAKSGGPGEETGIDNWRVVLQAPCPDHASCDDANACTTESCVAGVCERGPLDCSDGDDCTDDVCTAGACSHPPRSCDDGNDCTTDECVFGSCFSVPFADLPTVVAAIDELLSILDGPACGEELLKRPFLKKLAKKLKKARGKIDKADGITNLLRIPGLLEKAGGQLAKARVFLAAQATKGTISAECAAALDAYVQGIETCLAYVPTF